MKQVFVSIGRMVASVDNKLDNAFLNMERKVCGGKTVDEQLDRVDAKIVSVIKDTPKIKTNWFSRKPKVVEVVEVPFYQKVLTEVEANKQKVVKEVVVPAPKAQSNSPFKPCSDRKEKKTETSREVVQAIPLTKVCTCCGENIPVEANFCPMCRAQLVIAVAKLGPAPITGCKVKGMPPVKINPATKRTLGQRIKTTLTTDLKVVFKPMAKVNTTRSNYYGNHN